MSNRLLVPVLALCVVALAGLNLWQYRAHPQAPPAPAPAAKVAAKPAAPVAAAANGPGPAGDKPAPVVPGETAPCQLSERELIDRMLIRYTSGGETWQNNKWLGVPALKNPNDVWITQEILTEVKPDFVIDSGTFAGGSAAIWATVLAQVNPDARVITIDIQDNIAKPYRDTVPILKNKVDFLVGSSTAPEIVDEVKRRVDGHSAMVILDSLHTKEHVLNELRAYAPLVPVGSYIIVEDGVFNGHPVPEGWGPGPYEAIEAFLAENDSFVSDRSRERLLITSNPKGFLKRVK
jgi:cephalosporin hydroxylase